MKLLVQFLIPLICLRVVIGALLSLVRPRSSSKADSSRKGAERAEPETAPDLHDAPIVSAEVRRGRTSIRWKPVTWLGIGLLGLWASGFEVGWEWGAIPEWNEEGSPRLQTIIRDQCRPFIRKDGGSSLAVAVIAGADEALVVFGRESFTGPRASGRTVYEIGSITKAFTGIALAHEVERGALRLDQRVQDLLPPAGALSEPARSQVTLKHLTTHTSGFPRLPSNAASILDLPVMLFGGNPYGRYGEAQFFQALKDVKPSWTPGTRMEYSNFGTSLLGYALAHRAGTDYPRYIRRTVLQPLGMTGTAAPLTDDPSPEPAPGYRAVVRLGPAVVALRSWPWQLPNHLTGAGGLRSTPGDMRLFLRANLKPAAISSAITASHREIHHANSGLSVGMNWLRVSSKRLGKTVIMHNGGTGGFHTFIGFTEDRAAGVMVLSNRSESVDSLGASLLEDAAELRPQSAR